jgi:PAS domain S-box-containing protein
VTFQITRSFFQTIVESMNLGVIVVNEEGNVVYLNPAYESFIGRCANELTGKHISKVVEKPGIHSPVH